MNSERKWNLILIIYMAFASNILLICSKLIRDGQPQSIIGSDLYVAGMWGIIITLLLLSLLPSHKTVFDIIRNMTKYNGA